MPSMVYSRFICQIFILLNLSMIIDTKRQKRYLVYPTPSSWAGTKLQFIVGVGLPMEVDVSTIVGYVMKFNYVLPYNASSLTESYVRYERSIVENEATQPKGPHDRLEKTGSISRWDIYRMIESSLEGLSSGRSCLLRVICEAAALPFHRSHGIVAQLLHVLLTPSSTTESFQTTSDQEYRAAEENGRKNGDGYCQQMFIECKENILDYFTTITFH